MLSTLAKLEPGMKFKPVIADPGITAASKVQHVMFLQCGVLLVAFMQIEELSPLPL